SPIRRCFKSRPPLRTRCAGSPPAASHGCKGRRDLQRHLWREMLASQVFDLSDPRFSSTLGGCPASCPDTYRLTHDHRHVRNWARVPIRVLSPLRNNFFRLRTNFPNATFHRRALARASACESEQPLTFFNEV